METSIIALIRDGKTAGYIMHNGWSSRDPKDAERILTKSKVKKRLDLYRSRFPKEEFRAIRTRDGKEIPSPKFPFCD